MGVEEMCLDGFAELDLLNLEDGLRAVLLIESTRCDAAAVVKVSVTSGLWRPKAEEIAWDVLGCFLDGFV